MAETKVTSNELSNKWYSSFHGNTLVDTNETTLIDQSFNLPIAARLVVIYFGSGNANTASIDGTIRIYVNNTIQTSYSGVAGMEGNSQWINEDYPYVYTGITAADIPAGNVDIKVTGQSSSGSFDFVTGMVTVEAISSDRLMS